MLAYLEQLDELEREDWIEGARASVELLRGSLDNLAPEEPYNVALAMGCIRDCCQRALPYLLETGQASPVLAERLAHLYQLLTAAWDELPIQQAVSLVLDVLPSPTSIN